MNTLRHGATALILALCLSFASFAQSADPVAPPTAGAVASTLFGGLIDTAALPHNFAAFGGGVQGGSNIIGGYAFCHAIVTASYVCAGSKLSGSTTSNTLEYKQVVLAKHGFIAAINANGGVATGADGGTGGAFAAGGAVFYDISKVPALKKFAGYFVGASAEWDKRDVSEFVAGAATVAGLRAGLRPFASRGSYVFAIGKGW